MEQIKDVYNLPAESHATYKHKVELLLWYVDIYLPAAAGETNFGNSKRRYYKIVDKAEIKGKQRVLVESASEAFGLLLLENCYKKWDALCKEKAKNARFKVPKYNKDDPTTHMFHDTKFSEVHGGQGKGWSDKGRAAFEKYKQAIKDFRAKDKKVGWKIHQFCLDLIRKEHGITATEPPGRKSRKRKAVAIEKAEDIEEDDFVGNQSDGDYDSVAPDNEGNK